ncbi:hypothetical protein ALC60_00535 [Trachymyrmex zeteki]|uniref:Uncharacterized protein n=1 Tax=Mycetomoellerius zeteki TaxID=64791 RepID=A0A151XIA4_9HYME|nr:hypothetical protein ALC60_00535 [Trachymyrmex zeteki]
MWVAWLVRPDTKTRWFRCYLFPISLATNGEIPEKLRFHPNVDAGGVSASSVSQKFAVTSALKRLGAFSITAQMHKRPLENLKREPSGAVSVITY